MIKKGEHDTFSITLEESQQIFCDINELKNFLIDRYGFNEKEIGIIFAFSLNKLDKSLLIDIIYETYFNLSSIVDKDEVMLELYNKVLKIISYHVGKNNFKDKNSIFMKEFEYALHHYDLPDLGLESDGRTPKKR